MKNLIALLLIILFYSGIVAAQTCKCSTDTTFVVKSNSDLSTNSQSLRFAVNCYNSGCDIRLIKFELPINSKRITLEKSIVITGTKSLVIDGGGQAIIDGANFQTDGWTDDSGITINGGHISIFGLGFTNFKLKTRSNSDGLECIEVNGAASFVRFGAPGKGNYFYDNKFVSAISIFARVKEGIIQSNYFGTDGSDFYPNSESKAIRINELPENILIGGNAESEGNVILQNEIGIDFNSLQLDKGPRVYILKNYIGTTRTGAKYPNSIAGISINILRANFVINYNAINNGYTGVSLKKNLNTVIEENTISNNIENGISAIDSSSNIVIKKNRITGNQRYGIEVKGFLCRRIGIADNQFVCNKLGAIKMAELANDDIQPPILNEVFASKIAGRGTPKHFVQVYLARKDSCAFRCQSFALIGEKVVDENGKWELSELDFSIPLKNGDLIACTQSTSSVEANLPFSTSELSACTPVKDICLDFKLENNTNFLYCPEEILTLVASIPQGRAPFDYSWELRTTADSTLLRKGSSNTNALVLPLPKPQLGTYHLTVVDSNQCTASLLIPLTAAEATPLSRDACKKDFTIYKAFTPNGDEINEFFVIRPKDSNFCKSKQLLECFPNNELIIFNRWKDIVYRKSGYDNDWNAEDLPAGPYFYLFYPDRSNRKDFVDGSVAVLK